MKFQKLPGFSLTEVLIVLIIIGILILIALPNFLPKITEAKAQEAKLQLNHAYTLQKMFFYANNKYSDNLEEIDFEEVKLITEGGKANYKISISEINESGFIITAKSVVDFDNDGIYNTWQIDEKQSLVEIIKD